MLTARVILASTISQNSPLFPLVEKKTLRPIAVGGQAGGEKYIVQGIFFKFALDIFGIYGGDEYAMYARCHLYASVLLLVSDGLRSIRKAASHDLKGLINYYSCDIPGLHVPLMACICPFLIS